MDQNINGMGGLSLTPLAAVLEKMETTIMNLTQRIEALEKKVASQSTTPAAKLAAPAPAKTQSKPAPKDDDDDDVDLFGSDSEVCLAYYWSFRLRMFKSIIGNSMFAGRRCRSEEDQRAKIGRIRGQKVKETCHRSQIEYYLKRQTMGR